MQPQKVMRNMSVPTIISRMAGSTVKQAMAASKGGQRGQREREREKDRQGSIP